MTDQEMALRLGNYIIKLQAKIAALEGVFLEYKVNTPYGPREIPFRGKAKEVAQEEALQQVSAAQRDALLQAIAHETHSSALIRGLHRQFLEEE